jgi:ATP/maltotriose-dependent transcriptional regulator MalT
VNATGERRAPIQRGMNFLLDHLPHRCHVVLLGRTEPALPVPHFRAGGRLVEIAPVFVEFVHKIVWCSVATMPTP